MLDCYEFAASNSLRQFDGYASPNRYQLLGGFHRLGHCCDKEVRGAFGAFLSNSVYPQSNNPRGHCFSFCMALELSSCCVYDWPDSNRANDRFTVLVTFYADVLVCKIERQTVKYYPAAPSNNPSEADELRFL